MRRKLARALGQTFVARCQCGSQGSNDACRLLAPGRIGDRVGGRLRASLFSVDASLVAQHGKRAVERERHGHAEDHSYS